jgi:hypothetical protein
MTASAFAQLQNVDEKTMKELMDNILAQDEGYRQQQGGSAGTTSGISIGTAGGSSSRGAGIRGRGKHVDVGPSAPFNNDNEMDPDLAMAIQISLDEANAKNQQQSTSGNFPSGKTFLIEKFFEFLIE